MKLADQLALDKSRAQARARVAAHRARSAGMINCVTLDKEEENIVVKMTKKQKITRAQFIRNLIRAAV